MFQECFKEVSGTVKNISSVFGVLLRGFKATSRRISKQFLRSFRTASRKCYENFEGVSKKFRGVLSVFQGNFKGVSRVFDM